jgi:hypothetical protein
MDDLVFRQKLNAHATKTTITSNSTSQNKEKTKKNEEN